MNRYDDLMQVIGFSLPDVSGSMVMQFWRGGTHTAQDSRIIVQLEELERLIQSRLPDDYREFIQKYGGVLTPAGVHLRESTAEGLDVGLLSGFYPLLPFPDSNMVSDENLISIYKDEQNSVPDGYLRIAFGDNGYWYLAVRGHQSGNVFFHDSQAGGNMLEFENMHLIANNFDQFLQILAK